MPSGNWLVCYQVYSDIRTKNRKRIKSTLLGLGLRGCGSISAVQATPAVLGMIRRVEFLVGVVDAFPSKPTDAELVDLQRKAQRAGASLIQPSASAMITLGGTMSRIDVGRIREHYLRDIPASALAVMAEIVSSMHRNQALSPEHLVQDLEKVLPALAKYRPNALHPIAEVSLSRTAVERLLPYLLADRAETRAVVIQLLDWLSGFEPRLTVQGEDRRSRICALAALYGAHYGCILDPDDKRKIGVMISSDLDILTGGSDGVVLEGPRDGSIFRGYLYIDGRPGERPSFEHRHAGGQLNFSTAVDLNIPGASDERASFVVFENSTIVSKLALEQIDGRVTELR